MPPHETAIAPIAARRTRIEEEELTVALEHVRTALRGLAYGTVTISVQDRVVVQIDRNEKLRLDRPRGR
ncbi:MAG TPA: YezD family protein [Kofleriaceae bacterium]|nr:YezD family protein [Kofleriaceae bacterium]